MSRGICSSRRFPELWAFWPSENSQTLVIWNIEVIEFSLFFPADSFHEILVMTHSLIPLPGTKEMVLFSSLTCALLINDILLSIQGHSEPTN